MKKISLLFAMLMMIVSGAWATNLDRTGWTVLASSACDDNDTGTTGQAKYLIDGRTTTYWHSNWGGSNAYGTGAIPQAIQIDLGESKDFMGFTIQNRTDTQGNGRVTGYSLYVSDEPFTTSTTGFTVSDVISGKTAAMTGTLANGANTGQLSTVKNSEKMTGRYILFVATSSANNSTTAYACIAEFNLISTSTEPEAPTFTAANLSSLTTGWYQIEYYMNGSSTVQSPAKLLTAKETEETVGTSVYPSEVTILESETSVDNLAKTFVYYTPGTFTSGRGWDCTIKLANGRYMTYDGTSSESASTLYSIFFTSSAPARIVVTSAFTGSSRHSWLPATSTENVNYVGYSSSAYPSFRFSPVSMDDCNLAAWTVSMTGASSDVQLSYTGGDNYGLDKVYNNGAFFFKSTVTPTVDQFSIEGYDLTVTIDETNKVITVVASKQTTDYSAMNAALATAEKYTVGTGFGQYSEATPGAMTDAISTAKAFNQETMTEKATYQSQVDAATTALNNAVAGLSINLPKAGDYLRIKGSTNANYISNAETASGTKYSRTTDENAAIFYFDGTNLQSYATAKYMGVNKDDWKWSVKDAASTVVFGSAVVGKYYIYCADVVYLYDAETSVDRGANLDIATADSRYNSWILEKVESPAPASLIETRSENPNEYGTICLPYDATAKGAVVLECTGRSEKGLVFNYPEGTDDETATSLKAGVPYLFRATAAEQTFTCTVAPVPTPATAVNGFTGTYTKIETLDEGTDNTNYFLYSDNLFHPSNGYVYVDAYRCYFPTLPTINNARGAMVFGIFGEETTGINGIVDATVAKKNGKFIENGRMVIVNNGQKFNAAGQTIK